MINSIIKRRFVNYWGEKSSPQTYRYDDNGVIYGSVKPHDRIVNGTPFGLKDAYTVSGTNLVSISDTFINVVDIDWNKASTPSGTFVNLQDASQLLNKLQSLAQRITQLENT